MTNPNPKHHWKGPLPEVELAENEVHVWNASLQQTDFTITHLQSLLSTEEVARVERLHFEKDRRHWIVARGLLRILVGRYLKVDPRQIHFGYNPYGKPVVEDHPQAHVFQFNLSHSSELVLYAFTQFRHIGIDVEHMRPKVDYERLAHYHFSPYEYTVFCSLPIHVRQLAFFQCWTRKEAYLKARGRGLTLPLDQFDVAFQPGEPAALLCSREVNRWSLHELHLEQEYVGTLAVEGKDWELKCWQWLAYHGVAYPLLRVEIKEVDIKRV
jgi:4'-phosphopantetheinyl transferase